MCESGGGRGRSVRGGGVVSRTWFWGSGAVRVERYFLVEGPETMGLLFEGGDVSLEVLVFFFEGHDVIYG